uniref:TRAP transporter small permease n=1 Tax=Desulfatirhabdium butyrativorans TaxID=340467 RepID=A0A7C4RT99_9BACT
MEPFFKGVNWLSDKLKIAGGICLTGMMLMTCIDVIGRFFNRPILGAIEIVGFLATLTTAFALPYTHQMDAHIGVELFVQILPEKARKLLAFLTTLTSFLLFGVVSWRMVVYADTIRQSGEVSMTMKLPEYWIIYLVAGCFFVFFCILLCDTVKLLKAFGKPADPSAKP